MQAGPTLLVIHAVPKIIGLMLFDLFAVSWMTKRSKDNMHSVLAGG